MDVASALYRFMNQVKEDPRIGPSHISLYLAIVHCGQVQKQLPVCVFGRDLMKSAKISAGGTYHKCMKELKEYGYIQYVPSYNPVLGSLVGLNVS
jgi:hypothetical protein